MKQSYKRLLSVALAGVMTASVIPMALVSASATKNADGTYSPGESVDARTVRFAMPGCWQNDYWQQESCMADVYWWSGADVPDYPGYKMSPSPNKSEPNLYATPLPADVEGLLFNNGIDGGYPSADDFSQERFDAAQQTVDINCGEMVFGDSPYYTKALWSYVYDKLAEFEKEEPVKWDYSDMGSFTPEEKEQIRKLVSAVTRDYPDAESWEEFDKAFEIPEFGKYSKNFTFDFEGTSQMILKPDNMVYVCNLNPANMSVNTKMGFLRTCFTGAFFFDYGKGEFGVWPTKKLLEIQTGFTVENGSGKALKDDAFGDIMDDSVAYTLNDKDMVVRCEVSGGKVMQYMVCGDVTGKYRTDREIIEPATPDEPFTPADKPQWEKKSDGKVYFYADPNYWKNFKDAYVYLYDRAEGETIAWGSKKGKMTDEGENIWSFDVTENGYTLAENHNYGIIVSADWMMQTSDLIIAPECLGDMIYMTGSNSENPVDANKSCYDAAWVNMDSSVYGRPVTITSIGNVVGKAFWKGETAYGLFVDFLKNEGIGGVYYAAAFSDRTVEQTAKDTANALGLTEAEYNNAVAESGVDFDKPIGPYPYELPAETVAMILMAQYGSGNLASVDEIAELLAEYAVTPDEVDEAVFNYNDYEAYKVISEILSVIPGNTHPKGDMNGDGQVTVVDASLIQLFVADYRESLYPNY